MGSSISEERLARFGVTPHATRRMAWRQMGIGAAITATSVACAVGSYPAVTLAIGVFGPVFLWIGWHTHRLGSAVQVLNRAYRDTTHGNMADADELLAYAAERFRHPVARRIVDLQLALLAMRRGALEDALKHANAAIERPRSWWALGAEEPLRQHAGMALRALVLASLGRADEARADIARVRAFAEAHPHSRAHVELAEALILEHAGDRDGLRRHLHAEREVLLEHTTLRERAIVRAYERMLQSKPVSVYRKRAEVDAPPVEEPTLVDWVAKVAPGAAPFVRGHAAGAAAGSAASEPEAPVDPAVARGLDALTPNKQRAPRLLVLWILLIGMFMAVWMVLDAAQQPHGRPRPRAETDTPWPGLKTGAAIGLLLAGTFAAVVWRSMRHRRPLQRALSVLARGPNPEAIATLHHIARRGAPLTAASADHALAVEALAAAEPAASLAHVENGLRQLSGKAYQALASDILLPDLLALRAALRAALGHGDAARAEMVVIASRHPSYPFVERSRARVTLMAHAERGDVAALAALADTTGELALDPRDELVLDLARACVRPESAGSGEVQRLKATLRTDAASRRWLETLAPKVLAAFEAIRLPEIDERSA